MERDFTPREVFEEVDKHVRGGASVSEAQELAGAKFNRSQPTIRHYVNSAAKDDDEIATRINEWPRRGPAPRGGKTMARAQTATPDAPPAPTPAPEPTPVAEPETEPAASTNGNGNGTNIQKQVWDAVEALKKGGLAGNAAIAKVAADMGKAMSSVQTAYYRQNRIEGNGRGPRNKGKASTGVKAVAATTPRRVQGGKARVKAGVGDALRAQADLLERMARTLREQATEADAMVERDARIRELYS